MSHEHCHHEHHHGPCHHHGSSAECPCCQGTCGHHHHAHDHDDFSRQLIQMADEAWMEVLKEKIKEQIQALSGPNLDGLAKLVAQANHERWKHKMEKRKVVEEYREKLASYFNK